MQRLMQNTLAVAAVVGFTLFGARVVLARGAGGHSMGGRSVSSTSGHSTYHSTSKSISGVNKFNKVTSAVVLPPTYPPRVPRHPWPPFHMHYPVVFWFNFGLGGDCGCDAEAAIDVEFTSIRQLDAGDPAKNLAPAYRVWFHNNSDVNIDQAFDVAILASDSTVLTPGLPYAAVRVDGMAAGETMTVDIRLPIEAMSMTDSNGQAGPFKYLHTIIDSQNELVEINKVNNRFVAARADIPMLSDQ